MTSPSVVREAVHFKGMRYVADVADWDHQYVYRAQNLFPNRGVYWPRPGDSSWAIDAFAARTVQAEHVLRRPDGTAIDLVVAGGEVYRRPVAGTTFTKELTTANLTAAAITLSSSARVWVVTFNGQAIFSDGINTPFAWDGTSGGGLTKLTNAPVAYGPPFVYYAKLGFVKNVERNTFVWSEENQPNTGYEAGGFANVWALTQTSQASPLNRMLGLNDGLYYWRHGSIGVIRGAVTPDFSASGVHDSVAGHVGTTAPGAVVYYGNYVWFVDSFGRPYRFAPGGALEPLWTQMDAFFAASDVPGTGAAGRMVASDIALTLAAPYPQVNAVVFAYTPYSDAFYSRLFAFGVEDGQLFGEMDFGGQSLDHVGTGLAEGLEDIPALTASFRTGGQTQQYATPISQQGSSGFYSGFGSPILTFGPCAADVDAVVAWLEARLILEQIVNASGPTVSLTANNSGDMNFGAVVLLNAVVFAGSASQHLRRRVVVGLVHEQRYLWLQLILNAGSCGVSSMRARGVAFPAPALAT